LLAPVPEESEGEAAWAGVAGAGVFAGAAVVVGVAGDGDGGVAGGVFAEGCVAGCWSDVFAGGCDGVALEFSGLLDGGGEASFGARCVDGVEEPRNPGIPVCRNRI
jgi:hypothetical protein